MLTRVRHRPRHDAGGAGAHLRSLLPRRRRADGCPAPGSGLSIVKSLVDLHGGTIDRRERAGEGLAVHGPDPAPAARRGRAAAARGAARPQGAGGGRRAGHRRADRRAPRAVRGRDDDRALGGRGARAPAARALRRDDARHPDAGHERLRRARAGARRPRAEPDLGRLRVGLLGTRGARGRVDRREADRRRAADRRARLGGARGPHARARRGPRVASSRGSSRRSSGSASTTTGSRAARPPPACARSTASRSRSWTPACAARRPSCSALDLRGRRLRRAVLVFTTGEERAGIVATLGADPVPIEEAATAVLQVLSQTVEG